MGDVINCRLSFIRRWPPLSWPQNVGQFCPAVDKGRTGALPANKERFVSLQPNARLLLICELCDWGIGVQTGGAVAARAPLWLEC